MIKRILFLLICFLFVVTIARADGEIYLPIILGEDMAGNAILELTDGTVTINLLDTNIRIKAWNPQATPISPTFQSSPLSSGQELSSYKFEDGIETIDFAVDGEDQDKIIEIVQDTRRLLISGLNYHVVDWNDSIVYIRARANCETNIRYAVVKMFQLPEDDYPYGEYFDQSDPAMGDMAIIIERGDWFGAIPGVGECQQINSLQDWAYTTEWVVNNNFGGNAEVLGLLQAQNGYMYVGVGNFGIYRSINLGVAWVLVDAGSGYLSLAETKAGTILGGNFIGGAGRIRRSVNQGGAWATVLSQGATYSIDQDMNTGRIYATVETAAGEGRVYTSDDDGQNWTQRFSLPSGYNGGGGCVLRLGIPLRS